MNLPLLNDNLSGFSNARGVILGLLEELFWAYFKSIWLDMSWRRRAGRKNLMVLCLWVEKLVGLHDYLYMGGFVSFIVAK